jgi:hypothetical protein
MSSLKLSWLSTLLGTEDGSVRPLKVDEIGTLAAASKRITIVSAFFDTEFLDGVVAAIPRSRRSAVRMQVFLNAASGKRRHLDSEALQPLQARWSTGRNALAAASVRVVRRGGIFHSKLLVFEMMPSKVAVLIGSANATTRRTP